MAVHADKFDYENTAKVCSLIMATSCELIYIIVQIDKNSIVYSATGF